LQAVKGNAHLWDLGSGKDILSFRPDANQVNAIAFSPDGKQVLTASLDKTTILWEVASGKERRRFQGGQLAAFSPDGKQVLTLRDCQMLLWDMATGHEIRSFGPETLVWSVVFSPNGKQVLTASSNNTACLWDCESGREQCWLVTFRDGTWAVIDPPGRYDSSNKGDIEWLHGVDGNEIIPLKQLKGQRYDPGLLAKYMGLNKEPLRKLQGSK
jgi:WD40 repeat protein